jgi:hypothetical protein
MVEYRKLLPKLLPMKFCSICMFDDAYNVTAAASHYRRRIILRKEAGRKYDNMAISRISLFLPICEFRNINKVKR